MPQDLNPFHINSDLPEPNRLIEIHDCLNRLASSQEYLVMALEQFENLSNTEVLLNRVQLLISSFLLDWDNEMNTLLHVIRQARNLEDR